MKNQVITFSGITEKTEHVFEIVSDALDLLDFNKEDLKAALTAVDAQFYYTNPLLFLIVKDASKLDTSKWGHLWGKYYLVHIASKLTFESIYPVMLMNQTFVERFEAIERVMEDDVLDIEKWHTQHGLYVIAILSEH